MLALGIVALVHGVLAAQIENQKDRNNLLKKEIAKLDEQIKEIDRLRDQIQAVLARKQVVETLQANRSEAVHLLDQLVRQLPDGVYLRDGAAGRSEGHDLGLRPVQRARVDADAQPRGVAVARQSRARRDQAGARARAWRRTRDLKINEFMLNFLIKRAAPPTRGPAGGAAARGRPRAPAPDRAARRRPSRQAMPTGHGGHA